MFSFSLTELEKEVDEEKKIESEKVKLEIDEFLKITVKNLDENQLNALINTDKKVLVSGPAGSGKSMLAIRKVLDLKNNCEDFRIIIYTKALSKYLIGKLKRVNIKDIEKYILCGEKFRKTDINDNINYIVIDEVQDFGIKDLQFCFECAKKGYFLFGDDGQQVHPNRTNNVSIIDYLEKETDISSYKLNTTYRFPRKIALFSEQVKSQKENLSLNCIREGSNDNIPKIVEFNNFEKEMDYLYNVIINEQWNDVGILVKKNEVVNEIYSALSERGLVCDYKNEKEEHLDFSNYRPKIITYHSSKGLEFERVFIPQCNIYEDETTNYNYREALYVACTRATKTLIVSYSNDSGKSPYLDNINKKYYYFERK